MMLRTEERWCSKLGGLREPILTSPQAQGPREAPEALAAPQPQVQPAAAPAASGVDNNDMVAILKLLTASYGKVEAGEMSAADYAAKMRQLLEFARFILEK